MTGNVQIDQLVRSLLQKESLEQCSLQELEQFAGRHPYFGAAQLLLAKKMQVEQSEGYHDQLQKTYLFFNNPMWVQQLLGETGHAMIDTGNREQKTEDRTEEEPEVQTPTVELENEVLQARNDEITEVAMTNGESAGHSVYEPYAEKTSDEPYAGVMPEENKMEEKNELVIEAKTTPPDLGEREIVVEAVPLRPTQEKQEMLFEPFHTVDYFASQGIKLKLEDKPQDKFGQQLKSFTDWLKTMKRLPVTEIVAKAEPASEKKVEQLAEHSLEEKEVLTEAMAEVWVKQGNPEKAREIYRKLSLLDPTKSAYFAAKIEGLQK